MSETTLISLITWCRLATHPRRTSYVDGIPMEGKRHMLGCSLTQNSAALLGRPSRLFTSVAICLCTSDLAQVRNKSFQFMFVVQDVPRREPQAGWRYGRKARTRCGDWTDIWSTAEQRSLRKTDLKSVRVPGIFGLTFNPEKKLEVRFALQDGSL